MKCNKCGFEFSDDSSFCPRCGSPVNVSSNYDSQNSQYVSNGQTNYSDPTDHTNEFDPKDIAKHKSDAVLSYIGLLVLIPLIAKKESKFARFHVNQGLILLIPGVIISVLRYTLKYGYTYIQTPVLVISHIVNFLFAILIALRIWGIVIACKGKAKELPLIGKFIIIKY